MASSHRTESAPIRSRAEQREDFRLTTYLEGDDAIHAMRLLRSALPGFVSLESAGGFALPVGLKESYERLIEMIGRGLTPDRPDR